MLPLFNQADRLTEAESEELKSQLKPDIMLYNMFLKKHKIESDLFGKEKMDRFVQQLKELNEYAWDKCKIKSELSSDILVYQTG